MSHPPAVREKAQSLEQLLQRLEAGERLISVRAELELDVKAADVPHLRAKYEASGQTWESLLDGRYGHPQTAHSALREWMYQRKREDPTLTAGQLAEAVAAQFGVRLSAGHVNRLRRAPQSRVDSSAGAALQDPRRRFGRLHPDRAP